ncbi:hypothetical protein ACYULU_09525 [Breznakiellaceae bacterium SP9]
MNQEQVKDMLLKIEEPPLDFTVLFTGKKSKKINGFYKVDTREIFIHNRNFIGEHDASSADHASVNTDTINTIDTVDDNLLMYTAIHEYAHHLHACKQGGKLSVRAHTMEFWAILHELLEKAEAKQFYKNVFTTSPELVALTAQIREKHLKENGAIVKDLGQCLLRASDLCQAIGGRFEDYIDRILGIPRQAARTAIKVFEYDINTAVGPDNMRFLAGISNEGKREEAEAALLEGKSPDIVKISATTAAKKQVEEADPQEMLEKEKKRLERTIAALTKRLDEVNLELEKS